MNEVNFNWFDKNLKGISIIKWVYVILVYESTMKGINFIFLL